MRVIDLLNKIANGEEVPKKIKHRNKIFIYDKDNLCYVVENYNEYDDLLVSLSNHKGTDLNYEVEVIEEDKKIEPLKTLRHSCNFDRHEETLYENEVDLARKITELIDEVNKLKDDNK